MAFWGWCPAKTRAVRSVDVAHHRHRERVVRRLLVETAWHYRHRPSVGVALTRRRRGQPARVLAIADQAQQRLCRRFRTLAAAHKPAPKIAVAIARELAGFLWAALQPAPASGTLTAKGRRSESRRGPVTARDDGG